VGVRYCSQMSTSVPSDQVPTPTGRDEVVEATLTAAADLFAERGPAATSIRDVAERAGVNHGLIHRHVGAKDRLVGAVLDHLGEHLADLLATDAPRDVVDTAIDRQLRVIARTTLDGYPVGELQTRFPNVLERVARLRPHHGSERDARLAAAHVNALHLSWRLFGDFLRASAGVDDVTDAELAESIAAATHRIATPDER
jgi:TetR/AcrR family transcriptional regulator, repressor for neighboring sulfatase